MDEAELHEIEAHIDQLRLQASNVKTDDLVQLAASLGRVRRKGGKHLMYKSPLKGQRTVSITGHPSKPIGKGLALKIINQLASDIDAWRYKLKQDKQAKQTRSLGGNGHVH